MVGSLRRASRASMTRKVMARRRWPFCGAYAKLRPEPLGAPTMRIVWTACAAALLLAAPASSQQVADPDFKPKVERPAYAGRGPVVLIDEAHGNFHTASGRYAPFAALLKADGFDVRPNTASFSVAALKG